MQRKKNKPQGKLFKRSKCCLAVNDYNMPKTDEGTAPALYNKALFSCHGHKMSRSFHGLFFLLAATRAAEWHGKKRGKRLANLCSVKIRCNSYREVENILIFVRRCALTLSSWVFMSWATWITYICGFNSLRSSNYVLSYQTRLKSMPQINTLVSTILKKLQIPITEVSRWWQQNGRKTH